MDSPHVALVTGGSRGIGAAIARRLAADGAAVFVAARGRASSEELCASIEAGGGWARPLELDVTDPDSIRAAAAAAAAERGPVDWVVANAGIAVSAPALAGEESYREHLEVNFHGARRTAEAFMPAMLEAGRGAVLSVASSAGLRGYPYVAAYCASKHALLGYVRSLAAELGSNGIRFGAVCPHYVDSPMLDASVARIVAKTGRDEAAVRDFFRRQNPGGRLVTPEDVAAAVAEWLAEGRNGAVLEMDGSGVRDVDEAGG